MSSDSRSLDDLFKKMSLGGIEEAKFSSFENFHEMLQNGEDVNRQFGADGGTGLSCACWASRSDRVCEMLKNDQVDVNARDYVGNTALIIASMVGSMETVHELLQHRKVDVNCQNENGETALIVACT